jgi:Family of unknown function (DUF6011)
LREALAAAPAGPLTDKVRARANEAREAGNLSIGLVRALMKDLEGRAPQPFKPRPNKYRKPCERCGEWVEAAQGILERDNDDARWLVSHLEGECPVLMFEGVPEGRYAIDWGTDGAEDIKFYQIKQGKLYAQASAELWPINNLDQVNKALEVIKADPKGASILYGLKLGVCGICGRTLTNQESRDLGIGPICAKKMGW